MRRKNSRSSFRIGAPLFGVGIDEHVPAAAIDDERVARLHLPQNAPHARDRGNAATAGDDGGVAGLAAGLRDDAADLDIAQRDDLRREQLVGDHDHRSLEHVRLRFCVCRQVADEPHDHIAQVVQPLLQVFVVGAGKEDRVLVEQAVQGGLGSEAVVDDPAADLVGEGGIAKDRLVDAKDGSFFVPNLLLYLALQRAQLRRRLVAGGFVIGQFGGDFVVFQPLAYRDLRRSRECSTLLPTATPGDTGIPLRIAR